MSAPVPPAGPPPRAKRHRKLVPATVVGAAVALAAGILIAHAHANNSPATANAGGAPAVAAVGSTAPDGTFTTTAGTQTTIASLRGHTTVVWFVADGCASCAASIPAVAQDLPQLTGHGVQVLTLGLYGAFGTGRQGVAQLLAFGRAADGGNVERPGWMWGMPSEALSVAYDPSGNPDEYFVVGPDGRITYHNSVPVSTMNQLLAAAKQAAPR